MSKPTPPDGSDPRVLTPDPDEPDVWVTCRHSSSKRYHTQRCSVVEQMNHEKQVDKSVAEWSGHEKCDRCHRIETDEDYERPGAGEIRIDSGYHSVSPVRCLSLRALALGGHTHDEAADVIGVASSTAGRHIRGECTCDHHGHTVAYDADGANPHPAGDGGVPDSVRDGQTLIPATTCARIRRLLTDAPVSARTIATLFGASDTSVRSHAKGGDLCHHDSDENHPPVHYDPAQQTWVADHDRGGGDGGDP